MGKAVFLIIGFMALVSLKSAAQLNLQPAAPSSEAVKKLLVLPQNFYTQHLPYSCKKEGQLQKQTGLNLFIRLGSKDYVDYLERKPGSTKPF
jgi:hypothetical protein